VLFLWLKYTGYCISLLELLSSDTKWLRKGISQITNINFSSEKYAGKYLINNGSLYAAIFIGLNLFITCSFLFIIKYLIDRRYIL